MTATERTPTHARARQEPRQPDFVVRAKTGPGTKDWATVGYAWRREHGEGFSVKLNTVPIGNFWDGKLKLLPPFDDEAAGETDA